MQLHYGNLIDMAKNGEFDAIIHVANCYHTMGNGIAKHIKENFPEAYEADKKTGYGDKNKIGTFSESTININGHELTIINAYLQYRYGGGVDHFEYEYCPGLLQAVKAKYGDKKIGLPLIGCGLAGGDEQRIVTMIKENFEGIDYKLVEIDRNRKLKWVDQNLNKDVSIEKKTLNNSTEVSNISKFTKVSLPNGWMSNMAPYPVIYNGVEYKTTEHLFQCLRFEKYPEIQKEIMAEISPMAAKMKAKEHRHVLIEDGYNFLGQQDIDYMKLCIDLKLEQHQELKTMLLDTGSNTIIEDCTKRPQESGLFWGSAFQNDEWIGKNILGVILMEKRNELSKQLNNNNQEKMKKEYTYFFHLTSPFSNFHPSKFEYKEFTFISNEQFMMFSKAKTFKDEVTANKILALNQKGIAKDFIEGKISREDIVNDHKMSEEWKYLMMSIKKLGRGVQNYDEEIWNNRRYKVVLFGARLKFNQNEDLKQILLATGENNMVECAGSADLVWGCGFYAKEAKITPPEKWIGQNLLGKLLDELKIELRQELNYDNQIKFQDKNKPKP